MQGDNRTVQMKGEPVTLVGKQVKPGDKAPDAHMVRTDMSPVRVSDDAGKPRLYSIAPSLDTSLCNKQTVTFNKMMSGIDGDAKAYGVSCDLPFAQKRFADEQHIDNLELVSDYKDVSFGESFGVLIKELRLLSRGVVVVDKDDTIKYMQIVDDIGTEPDYEKAIAALKEAMEK
jgi:thiol peroxidase